MLIICRGMSVVGYFFLWLKHRWYFCPFYPHKFQDGSILQKHRYFYAIRIYFEIGIEVKWIRIRATFSKDTLHRGLFLIMYNISDEREEACSSILSCSLYFERTYCNAHFEVISEPSGCSIYGGSTVHSTYTIFKNVPLLSGVFISFI